MAEKKNVETPENEKERTVTIRLPLIPGVEKQEALYVGICAPGEGGVDRSFVIPRGKSMEVPWYVAEIIEHSENEAIQAAEYRAAHAI